MITKFIKRVFFSGIFLLAAVSQAATVSWDGGAGNGLWSSAANWSGDALPVAGDTININGVTVNYDVTANSGQLPAGCTVNLTNTVLNTTAVLRMNGSTINVRSGSTLSGSGWWDLDDGSFVFDSGAAATMSNWEQKDLNRFTFNLSSSGFTTLTPGTFRLGAGTRSASIANATYIVNMANYTGGAGPIKLMDFSTDGASMNNATFQSATLVVTNAGSYVASIQWNDTDEAIELIIQSFSLWDNGAGDNNWTTAANWNPDGVPVSSANVIISSGATVTNAQNVFSKLQVASGATVTFAADLASGNVITNAGVVNKVGVWRLNGASVTLESGGSLGSGITWLDTYSAIINFVDGAAFNNTTMPFEHKGNNTFGYKLSATGFTTLVAGKLWSGSSAAWSNVTYNINLSDYNYTNGLSITLMDYSSHDAVYSGTFNPTVNIIAGGSGLGGTLSFNTADSKLMLAIDPPGNDAPTAYNQTLTVFSNTPIDFTLVATDPENDALTYTLIDAPTNGTLSGTAPNLTYTPDPGMAVEDYFTFTATDIATNVSNTGTVTIVPLPTTVAEVWSTCYGAITNNPLNIEWLTCWTNGSIAIWQIRYDLGPLSGTQTNANPKIAAYYAYPIGGTNLPGLVQIHGGGQRASSSLAQYWAEQGYAAISINWGGLPLEAGYPNTDWDGLAAGFVRDGVTNAIHHEWTDPDVYNDGCTLFDVAHPLNSSWLLNSYAGRRALTFLTSQSIVNGSKLGVTGHSMGGRTTVITSTDPRITCVTPSVGGSGFLYEDWWGVPGSARSTNGVESLDLYNQTVGCESYWPDITCPTLFLEATDDFNAPFDLVIRAMALQSTNVPQRLAVAPHFNHRFDTASYASRVLWQKAYLTGAFDFPKTSVAELDLVEDDGVPVFRVWPDTSTTNTIVSVDIYYGIERDILNRFWRDAQAVATNGHWEAKCPVYTLNEPLVALAVVTYDCGFNLAMPAGYSNPTRNFSVASEVSTIYPPELANNGVLPTAEKERLIDDFSRGLKDWYTLSGDSAVHWMYYTRKVNDPSWKGPGGGNLSFSITTTAGNNTLAIKMLNAWNEGPSTSYVAYIPLSAAGTTNVSLPVSAFTRMDNGTPLSSWDVVKYMGITSAYKFDSVTYPDVWQGAIPVFSNLHWEGGEYTFTNGITSTWLESYGLGLNDLTVLSDTDGDGLVSWEEFVAGTNPTNSASALRLSGVTPVNNGQAFSWQAVAGKNYSVWFKTNLTDSVWVEKGAGIPGVEPACTHTVVTDSATGFVRIEVAP